MFIVLKKYHYKTVHFYVQQCMCSVNIRSTLAFVHTHGVMYKLESMKGTVIRKFRKKERKKDETRNGETSMNKSPEIEALR